MSVMTICLLKFYFMILREVERYFYKCRIFLVEIIRIFRLWCAGVRLYLLARADY